ncbi:MAG: sulfatase-like hydrolase/transferase [Chitinophagaceae bacterium]|nr:sulfatase-like hydrolase/transferase [Chitinophagaceae bacterium]
MSFLKKIVPVPLHCFLVPVYFIVHNYFDFFGLVDFKDLLLPMLGWIVTPFVLYFLLGKVLRDKYNAGLFTTVLLLIYFFFAPAHQLMKSVSWLQPVAKYSVLLPLLFLFIAALFFYLRKNKQPLLKLHRYLLLTLLVLLLADGLMFGISRMKKIEQKNVAETIQLQPLSLADSLQPDIFFLVFDEHPSTASVKRLSGYDNSMLDSELTKMGFYVSPDAVSGYAQTISSLHSILNMTENPGTATKEIGFREIFRHRQQLLNNRLFSFLQQHEYHIYNGSILAFKDHATVKTSRSWWGKPGGMVRNQTFFNRVYLDIGWLRSKYAPSIFGNPLIESFKDDSSTIAQANAIVDASLQQPAQQKKMVFAHFLIPHFPYKYDSTGSIRYRSYHQYLKELSTQQPYAEQMAYTRNFILKMVKKILEQNKRPAIIIIQGDHGLRSYNKSLHGENEMFRVLSAIYWPNKNYSNIPAALFTPNTFRIILNQYYQQQIPLQQPWHHDLALSDGFIH